MSNAFGRLAATAQKSGGKWQVTLYSYDSRGRIASKRVLSEDLTSTKTTFAYTYDLQDNVVTTQTTVGSASFGHWYDYDTLGRLWKIFAGATKPASPDVTYAYTSAGMVSNQVFFGGTTIPTTCTIRDWVDGIDNLAAPSESFAAKYLYFADGIAVALFQHLDSSNERLKLRAPA